MIEIKEKKDCCGCYACQNICPKNCITMIDDNEGFWYPNIDKKNCINCNLCEKVCPMKTNLTSIKNIKYLAVKNKNKIERLKSSSGGVFSALSNFIIANNGVIFGATFDKNLEVIYDYADVSLEYKKFRGSKYVQSRVLETYKQAKVFLDNNRLVLFSGTPCHIAGLNSFLNKEYSNLILIDIACHGVPSPKVYKEYKKIISKKHNSEIKQIQFRDKHDSWKNYDVKYTFNSGEVCFKKVNDDFYMKGFLKDIYLRPSCYDCNFKKPKTAADITLADYWGVQNIHPEFDDDKGTSLVLINTKKGEKVFNEISNNLDIIETDGNHAINHNPCIVRPVKYNSKREVFFKNFEKLELVDNIEKNIKISIATKIKIKIYSIIIKFKISDKS